VTTNLIYTHNHQVPQLLSNITYWAKDRNLIEGSTPQQQFPKLLEEVIELYATLHNDQGPEEITASIVDIVLGLQNKGKIKQALSNDPTDDIGDCGVVLTLIAEQHNLTISSCLAHAYNDIKDRKGMMIDGVFVKETVINSK